MPSPDLIAPDRLEELLGGALPEAEREARLQGLVRELRADAPAAPAALRDRVRALEEQPARRRPALPRRRTALALAFVLVALAAVGAGLALRDEGEPTRLDSRPPASLSEPTPTVPAPAPMQESRSAWSWPTACVRKPRRTSAGS